jgi:hypothetical protein
MNAPSDMLATGLESSFRQPGQKQCNADFSEGSGAAFSLDTAFAKVERSHTQVYRLSKESSPHSIRDG